MQLNPDWWVLLAVIAAVHFVFFRRGRALLARVEGVHDVVFYAAYGVACALVPYFMPVSAMPFIYFQF